MSCLSDDSISILFTLVQDLAICEMAVCGRTKKKETKLNKWDSVLSIMTALWT